MERIDRMAELYEEKEEKKITIEDVYALVGEMYNKLNSLMEDANKAEVDEEEKVENDEDEKDSDEEDKGE